MLQDEKDILLHAIDNTEDVLLHRAWSEEAKQRVREARRAGRKVSEMFANLYSTSGRFIYNTAGKATKRFANVVYKKAKKFYNDPRSVENVSGYDSHFAKPMRVVKNKNGTTTKYYDGLKSRTTASRSLKDMVHGRKGKIKTKTTSGKYIKTYDKKGKLKSSKYYTDNQVKVISRALESNSGTKRHRKSRK